MGLGDFFGCELSDIAKVDVGVLIAVPEQTAIDRELFRLQTEIEYLIGNDEEIYIFVRNLILTQDFSFVKCFLEIIFSLAQSF